MKDKHVTYAHKDNPNGLRFLDFADSVPKWAVDIQDYEEPKEKTMNALELSEALFELFEPTQLTQDCAVMLRTLHAELQQANAENETFKAMINL